MLVALVAAGCGSSSTVTVTTTETVTETTTAPTEQKTVRVYFLRDGKVGPVARTFDVGTRAALLAAQAAGPTAAERAIGFDPGEANERLAATVFTLSQFDPAKPVVDRRQDLPALGLRGAHAGDPGRVAAAVRSGVVAAALEGTANTFEATFEYDLLDPAARCWRTTSSPRPRARGRAGRTT